MDEEVNISMNEYLVISNEYQEAVTLNVEKN